MAGSMYCPKQMNFLIDQIVYGNKHKIRAGSIKKVSLHFLRVLLTDIYG